MSAVRRGLILALVQVLLVTLVAAKLMIDRARYPQVWVETAPYDPDLPLRGRYVRLLAVVEAERSSFEDENVYQESGRLETRDGRLFVVRDEDGPVLFNRGMCRDSEQCITLSEPLAFFIPEDIPDPSIRDAGEELWVKVTVPPRGAPRPIQLGVRRNGKLTPLTL